MELQQKINKKSIHLIIISNIFDYYSITLYAFFATVLTPLFFPAQTPTISTLIAFSFFAAGFLMRPVGAIFFGTLGDQKGRKKTLLLSIIFTTIPTFIIGFLPTFDQIGLLASIIIIICRLVQGFSVAASENGPVIFVSEHAKRNQDGFAGSLLSASSLLGAFIAASLGALCLYIPSEWLWRLPFFLGGILGVLGYFLRTKISETQDFLDVKNKDEIHCFPLLKVLQQDLSYCMRCLGITAATLAPFYIACTYITNLAQQNLHFSDSSAMLLNTFVMLAWIIVLPLVGWLSDKVGKIKIMSISAIGIIFISYPVFWLLKDPLTISSVICAQILLCLLGASYVAPANAVLPKLFSTNKRYSGMGFSFSVGSVLFGGLTPLAISFVNYLTQTEIFLAIYLIFVGFIGWCSLRNVNLHKTEKLHLNFQLPSNKTFLKGELYET
jgi:MHS family proline/betaine transporter-like MFS transporter